MNVLFITADDLAYDSPGMMGNTMLDITPNLDKIASGGILFTHCFGTTPICGPARNSIFTGQYPHVNGFMGHFEPIPKWWTNQHGDATRPSLTTELKNHNYLTAVIGKHGSDWCDFDYTWGEYAEEINLGRDPESYYSLAKKVIDEAQEKNSPFFISANIHDPHRYWAGHPNETQQWINNMLALGLEEKPENDLPKPYPDPDKTYSADEVMMPPAFPDEPEMRERFKYYYDSVHRMDQTIGRILDALEETGNSNNTLVIFVSDHGPGWPFAKWTLYPYGVRSSLTMKCPEFLPENKKIEDSVSSTSIAPTILDLLGMEVPPAMNGKSLKGKFLAESSTSDEPVFSCFNYMDNKTECDERFQEYIPDLHKQCSQYRPMRALNNSRFCYVWNGWVDGETTMQNNMGSSGETIVFMQEQIARGINSEQYQKRLEQYFSRSTEELYDTEADPGCYHNLADQPEHQKTLQTFRQNMEDIMRSTKDHELQNYQNFLEK